MRTHLFRSFILAIAFVLPLWEAWVPYLIWAAVLAGIVGFGWRQSPSLAIVGRATALLLGYFALQAVSALYSQHGQQAVQSLDSQLALIAVPWLLSHHRAHHPHWSSWLGWAFVAGNVAALVWDTWAFLGNPRIVQGILEADWPRTVVNCYAHFSLPRQHPAYLSLHLTVAMGFLLHWARSQAGWRAVLAGLLVGLFGAVVLLISSRAAYLALLGAGVVWALYAQGAIRRWAYAGLWVAAIGALAYYNPRIQNKTDEWQSSPSFVYQQTRIGLWTASAQAIAQAPLWGHGVGDRQWALQQSYHQLGLQQAAEHRLVAHNQYLDTLLSVGLPGLFLLVTILVWALADALRTGQGHLATFAVVMGVHLLFESMLLKQLGATTLALFLVLWWQRPLGSLPVVWWLRIGLWWFSHPVRLGRKLGG